MVNFRHNFKIAFSYRDVDLRDEVLDRRRRQRGGLWSRSEYTKSGIYRNRHDRRSVDPDLDDLYLKMNQGQEQSASKLQASDDGESPRHASHDGSRSYAKNEAKRAHDTTLNALATRNKHTEDGLLSASEGKLNEKILVLGPSSDMTVPEMAEWNTALQAIVTDMKGPSTDLGLLVEKIRGAHRSSDSDSGETELATDFTEFCNIIAWRLAQGQGEDGDMTEAKIFQVANCQQQNTEDIAYANLDNIVHVTNTEKTDEREWQDVIAFGQIKTDEDWDIKDELIGGVFRYMLKILEDHSVTGRSVCFTLCGHLLRIFEIDPVGFSTSAPCTFHEEADYEAIVCAVALLCSSPSDVLQHWQPSANETLLVKKPGGDIVRYRLSDVRALAISPVIWGSRTAAWSAQAEQLDRTSPKLSHESLPLIIKSTWLPNSLYAHEMDILEIIDDARAGCFAAGTFVPLLPHPVGHVVNAVSDSHIHLGEWTINNHGSSNVARRNTTMVTFCEPGRHVDEDMPTLSNHVRLHRSLTRTLGWLAEHGIHYRDLNNGNVLRSATGQCILIDFGNARFLRRPRGQTKNAASETAHISLDDAQSGTLMFMSRRIHNLTNMDTAYRSDQAVYEADLRKLQAMTDFKYRSIKEKLCQRQKVELDLAHEEMKRIHHDHRYIDDGEGQLYLMMQQILFPSRRTDLFASMEDLAVKRRYWDQARVPLNGADLQNPDWDRFEDVAIEFRWEVNACLKTIENGLANGSLNHGDGWAYSCEKECFRHLDEIWENEEARQEQEEKERKQRSVDLVIGTEEE